jgi:hypothetical protein
MLSERISTAAMQPASGSEARTAGAAKKMKSEAVRESNTSFSE